MASPDKNSSASPSKSVDSSNGPSAASASETTSPNPETTRPAAETTDDEMRRRYREALERKHGGGPGGNTGHSGPKSALPSSNDKTQRVFRRKSGG